MQKILIVDDEKKIRDSYGQLLRQQGFSVLEAGDGRSIGQAIFDKDEVDLVLLDIRLPMMSTSSVFMAIKTRFPQAKVLVLSVYSVDDQKKFVNGADAYYSKMEGPEALINRIRHILTPSNVE